MNNMMGTDCPMGWGMILAGGLAAGLALRFARKAAAQWRGDQRPGGGVWW